jgi:hypothetical protein
MIGFFVKYIQKKTPKKKKTNPCKKKKSSKGPSKQHKNIHPTAKTKIFHDHNSKLSIIPLAQFFASNLKPFYSCFFFLSLLLLLLLPCKFHKIKKYILNSPTLIEIVKLNVVAVVF